MAVALARNINSAEPKASYRLFGNCATPQDQGRNDESRNGHKSYDQNLESKLAIVNASKEELAILGRRLDAKTSFKVGITLIQSLFQKKAATTR